MPIHDWTRVIAGTFHDFHQAWITHLRDALNSGVLPEDYYAQAEPAIDQSPPDLLTLKAGSERDASAESGIYARRQNALVIHRSTDDRVVARLQIVSLGDKSSKRAFQKLLDRALSSLSQKINLLVIDLHPPTKHDPQGLHGALWAEIEDEKCIFLAQKPLTLAAYAADQPVSAYVDPVAVGDVLPEMHLFVDHDRYVPAPLEATYQAAWRGVPRRWKKVLEG